MLNRVRFYVVLAVAVALVALPSSAFATFYPDKGDWLYDGGTYGDSYFKWTSPGPWIKTDPAFELDWVADKDYFTACTTWTDLPGAYDDCVTAGVLEEGENWAFSIGAYHANDIDANTEYLGVWSFTDGNALFSPFYFQGQENERYHCSWDSPWCMESVQTATLINFSIYWSVDDFREWGGGL